MNDNFFLKIGIGILPAVGVIIGFFVATTYDPVVPELKKLKETSLFKPTCGLKCCQCKKETY